MLSNIYLSNEQELQLLQSLLLIKCELEIKRPPINKIIKLLKPQPFSCAYLPKSRRLIPALNRKNMFLFL